MMFKAIIWRESKRSVRRRVHAPKISTVFYFLFMFGLPFLFAILLSVAAGTKTSNGLFFFLIYSTFFAASTFTNFKEDWRGNMFDYLLSMPISPTSYILSCGLSAAFLTSVLVMPVALLLAHCMQTFFGISLTIVDVALVVCIPPVLSFIISLSSATYLIFSLKTQYAYGIAYAILLFTVLIILPFSQIVGNIGIHWINFSWMLAILFVVIDALIFALLDKERAVTKE